MKLFRLQVFEGLGTTGNTTGPKFGPVRVLGVGALRRCGVGNRRYRARMSTPTPRPTMVRLLQVGDTIRVSPPGGDCWATITALHDDEPNRVIHIDVTTERGKQITADAAPGHKFDRLAEPDDTRETVMVEATDFWKWIGTHINHPNTGQRVMVMDVRPARHPDDNREIVAIAVAQGPVVFFERTGHLVFEDN